MDRSSRIPLSLTDLKRKKQEDKERIARPIFLTKVQREKIAPQPTRSAKRPADQIPNQTTSDAGRNSNEQLNTPRRQKRTRFQTVTSPKQPVSINDRLPQQTPSALRSQYLDKPLSTRNRSQNSSTRDRNHFQFGWDDKDDTMNEIDPDTLQLRKMAYKASFNVSSRNGRQKSDILTGAHRRGRNEKNAHLYDHRHWSQKRREEMTARDWRIFREDLLITVRSSVAAAPLPARNWDETGLPDQLLHLIRSIAKYDKPSPIQMSAIPIVLSQKDCIGLAETGSGKTAAFVLPLLAHISLLPPITSSLASRGPYALILAPTRELALQIDEEARKFGHHLGIRVVHIIGGQELDVQAITLEAGCEVVVCTPGRMVDLLSRQMAALGNCQYLVLDEADRMIDMGFEPQLAEVLDAMPPPLDNGKPSRQTYMFSATMSPAVERMAKTYLHDPVVVAVGETNKAADNVIQKVAYFPSENRRRERFYELLEILEPPILVFVNTRRGCDMVYQLVEKNIGLRPAVMHSGKSQEQREKTLEGFRTGKYEVLIATDVVGRGIDIRGIQNVVNFELPKTIEAYTHRIGRTGRAGDKGTAWSLATDADTDLFGSLVMLLSQSGAHIPPELTRGQNGKHGKGFRPILD